MAKAKKTETPLSLSGNEQSNLRILLALREQANASASAANATVRNYLIQLLQGRGLDPQKWGVTSDMTAFTEIQAPVAQAAPPTGAPAPGTPAPEGKQTFSESAPAPAAS